MAKGMLHAQRDERHLRGAHVANEATHNGVGLGNPIERCRARAGAIGGGSAASFRWRKIFRITAAWVMAAIIRRAP
jgi:hypothetical protein